jgi:hypothetical protein
MTHSIHPGVGGRKHVIRSLPGEAWSRLRSWAAERRSLKAAQAETLVRILDSAEDLRQAHPELAGRLWKSAQLLASKMGYHA